MGTQRESNFPNSRLTAALQAYNVDAPDQLLSIQGQAVGGKNCLMVQIAQAGGNPLLTNANMNQFQGLSDFNISNAFIPEGYDRVEINEDESPTTAAYRYYRSATFKAKLVVTYTDATKTKTVRVQRSNVE